MWEAKDIEAATRAAAAEGIGPPCAAQMGYSIVSREDATTERMLDALRTAGAGLVAASPLEGGLLTGKYGDQAESRRLCLPSQGSACCHSARCPSALSPR